MNTLSTFRAPRKGTLINIVLIALIAATGCVIGANYLLNTFLPEKITAYAQEFARNALQKRIKISRIEVDLFKGIELRDVTLYELREKTPYMVVRRVRALPFYPSLLNKKKWFFSCTLDGVAFNLVRTKEGFNVPDLNTFFSKKPDFFINVIAIKNLDLGYQDTVTSFAKEFKGLFCVINMSFSHAVHLQARWPDKINIRGEYNLKTRQSELKASISDIDLTRLNLYSGTCQIPKAFLEYASLTLSGKDTYELKANAGLRDIAISGNEFFEAAHADLKLTIAGIHAQGLRAALFDTPNEARTRMVTPMQAQLRVDNLRLKGGLKGSLQGQAASLTTTLSSQDIGLGNVLAAFSGKTSLQALTRTVSIHASTLIENFTCEKDDAIVTGNAEAHYQLPLAKDDPKITCVLRQARVILPGFGELKDVYTDMAVAGDALSLNNLNALYKGQKLKAKATISEFNSPVLYAEFQGAYPLTWLLDSTPQLQRFKGDYRGDARVSLQGTLKGNIVKRDINYFVEFALNGFDAGPVHDASAKGYAQKDKLVIHEAQLRYKKIPLTIRGSLEDFSTPDIFVDLQGPNFWAKARAGMNAQTLEVRDLILGGTGSKLTSKGKIELKPKVSFDLLGSGFLDCRDLFAWRRSIEINNLLDNFGAKAEPLVPKFFSKFNKDNLRGVMNIKFIVKGGEKPGEWEIKLAGDSPSMQVYQVKALKTRVEFYKNKDELTISPLVCDVAGGKLEFRTHVDFKTNKAKFDIVGNDLDLSLLRQELALKNKKLAGSLDFEAYVDNNSLQNWDKLDGEGKIKITRGNIAQLNLLKGLGELLFIPDFDEIVFEEGMADLYFRNNQVVIDNIALNSLEMNIKGGGKIALSGVIHFLLFPEFNAKLVAASDSLKKITTGLLGKALLVEIQGTIQKPQYQVKPTILYPINKIKSFFNELMN